MNIPLKCISNCHPTAMEKMNRNVCVHNGRYTSMNVSAHLLLLNQLKYPYLKYECNNFISPCHV